MPLKTYRHMLHPPSKIILNVNSERVGYGKETMKVDRNQATSKIVEGYRLAPRKHGFLIDCERFKRTLSMGPKANIPGLVYFTYKNYNQKMIKTAVLTIERYWLGYKYRKEFRNKQMVKKAEIEELLAKKRRRENAFRRYQVPEIIPIPTKKPFMDLIGSPGIGRNSAGREDQFLNNKKKKMFSEVSIVRGDRTKARREDLPAPSTPLQKKVMLAARTCNLELLETGTKKFYPEDVNTADCVGNTPLHYAAKVGNKGLCQFLIEKGAIVDLAGQEGNTPLHLAYLSGNTEVKPSL